MTAGGADESGNLGRQLYDAGWRQGAVFDGSGLAFGSNRIRRDTDAIELHRRALRRDEQLIVVSQDCDITSTDDPFVEALICTLTSPERARRLDRNSARWFVINPDTGFVVAAKYRVQIAKEALARYTPLPWPASITRYGRFVRWLGRRYDRPALPDQLVEFFQQPVTILFESLDADQPEIVSAFSTAIHEIRVTDPLAEEPPFAVNVMLMARRDALSLDEDRAVQHVEQGIRASLDPARVRLGTVAVRLEEEMSVAEFFATRPVFLEYLTYRGDEVEGTEPLTEE